MERQLRKFTYAFTAFVLVVLFISSFIVSSGMGAVYAATSGSNVLDDLKKDESFNVADYPAVTNDYSLNVIQIAESTDGELLIYVYQPSGQNKRLIASKINFACQPNNTLNLTFINYDLEYLNSHDVFFKYKVLDFKVNDEDVRYYNISNILRPYDSSIDDEAPDGNSIPQVENGVGQLWTAVTAYGTIKYSMKTSETIEITKKYVGYVEYSDGVDLGWSVTGSATDAHFVAFSTDKPMDKLLQAELSYNEREVNAKICANVMHVSHKLNEWYDYEYGTNVKHQLIVDYTDSATNPGGGNIIKGKSQSWNRIRKTSEFISDEKNKDYKITNSNIASLDGTQWVLSFHETQIEYNKNNVWLPLLLGGGVISAIFMDDISVRTQEVSDVMILRLKFEKDGNVYNLGVVDNMQTNDKQTGEDREPGNTPTQPVVNRVQPWVWIVLGLLGIIAVIAAVVVLCIFFPPAAKGIGTFFKYLAIGLWYIISAPFRLIALIVRKIAERKEAAPAKSKSKPKRSKSKPRRTSRAGKARTGSKRK